MLGRNDPPPPSYLRLLTGHPDPIEGVPKIFFTKMTTKDELTTTNLPEILWPHNAHREAMGVWSYRITTNKRLVKYSGV